MSEVSSDDEVFIIEAEEQLIPWASLSDDERYRILIRELAENIKQFKDEDFIKNISELMGRITQIEANPWDKLYKMSWTSPDIGSSDVIYRTIISKSIDKGVIIDGETINLQALDVNLNFISKLGYNVIDYEKNLRHYNVVKREWPKYFSSKSVINSKNLRLLNNLYFNIADYFQQTAHNTVKYDEKQLVKAKNKINGIIKIKEVIPNRLIENRIKFNDKILEIYGQYYGYDTLSDIDVGRVMFLAQNKNLGNALPYFLIEANEAFKNYKELVYLKNSLRQIYKAQKVKDEIKEINKDIFEEAISNQLGNYILEKFKQGKLALTSGQLRIVERFITLQKDLRTRYEKNTCPHINIRKKFDETLNLDEKRDIFRRLIERFGKNGFDPETRFLFCSNCGFNMGCQHEVLMFLHANDTEAVERLTNDYYKMGEINIECRYCGRKIKDAIIEQEIQFDDNNRRVLGTITEQETDDTIFLRNRINEILIYAGVSSKVNPYVVLASIAGIVFEKFNDITKKQYSSDRTLALRKIQSYAYTWAYLTLHKQLRIKMFKDLTEEKEIRKVIYKKMDERDSKFIQELENLDLRANFVNAISRARQILEKNDFKNYKSILVAKRLFGYKMAEYIDKIKAIPTKAELVKLDRQYLIQVFRGIKPLQNRKYFKEHYPPTLEYNKSFKITKKDQEHLQEEIKVFLESACAGDLKGNEKIKWKGVDINCKNIDKSSEQIVANIIERTKKSKMHDIVIDKYKYQPEKKVKIDLAGSVQMLDKLITYFGTEIGVVRSFIEKMRKMQLIEVKNIIARLVREYRRIHNNDFANSPSTKYLEEFNSKNFAIKLKPTDKDTFVDILLTVVKNKEVADYIIEFIRNVEFSLTLSQTSINEIDEIDEEIETQRRKNWETYGKMTPEEKLQAEFGGKGIEEQVAILTRKQQEQEELQRQMEQDAVVDDPDFVRLGEENLDELQSIDHDDIYITGSFETY